MDLRADASPDQALYERKKRPKAPEPGAPFNEIERVIFTRRSVRAYRPKQVEEHLVRRVLEAGRYAPSAGNGQPWRFVVVRDPELIDSMTAHITQRLTQASDYLDYTKPNSKAVRFITELLMKASPNNFHPTPLSGFTAVAQGKLGIWHGAPTVIFLLVDMRSPGSPLVDIGIAGQNMVLAAHSMGLGTCWVSFAKILEASSKFKKVLGIKHPYKIVSTLALGYPRGNPDGFVERETQESLWIEPGGATRTVT